MAHARRHAAAVLRQVIELDAVEDRDAGRRPSMREQDRFEVDLVDPVWRLRGRPPGIRATLGGVAVAAARDRDARNFPAHHRRAIGDVIGVVHRQPGVPDLPPHTEAAEQLHRSGGHMVALDARRLAALSLLDHRHPDAAPGEVHGEGQPHRPAADNCHIRFGGRHQISAPLPRRHSPPPQALSPVDRLTRRDTSRGVPVLALHRLFPHAANTTFRPALVNFPVLRRRHSMR